MSPEEADRLVKKSCDKFAGVIYCYTNRVNGKKYIGQTIEPITRHLSHVKHSRYQYKELRLPFHKALAKYGVENFKYEILDFVTAETYEELKLLLNAFEIVQIYKNDAHTKGYNATIGGEGVGVGKSHPNAKQILEYNLETKELTNTYGSLVDAGRAHRVSDGVIRNLVKHKTFSLHGKVFCYEGESPLYEDPRPVKPRIHYYTLEGAYAGSFSCLQEACDITGIPLSSLSQAVNGKTRRHKAGNYMWFRDRRSCCVPYSEYDEMDKYSIYDSEGKYHSSYPTKTLMLKALGLTGSVQLYKALRDPKEKVRGFYIRTFKQPSIDPININPIEKPSGVVVSSYDEYGQKISSYPSRIEAAKAIGYATSSCILTACHNPWKKVNGLYWREGIQERIEICTAPIAPNTIAAFDANTMSKIGEYPHAPAASKALGVHCSGVYAVLKGAQKSSHGIIFKYII